MMRFESFERYYTSFEDTLNEVNKILPFFEKKATTIKNYLNILASQDTHSDGYDSGNIAFDVKIWSGSIALNIGFFDKRVSLDVWNEVIPPLWNQFENKYGINMIQTGRGGGWIEFDIDFDYLFNLFQDYLWHSVIDYENAEDSQDRKWARDDVKNYLNEIENILKPIVDACNNFRDWQKSVYKEIEKHVESNYKDLINDYENN